MDQKDTFQQLLEQHISSLNKFKKDNYVITKPNQTQQQPDPDHQQPNRTQQQPDPDHQQPNRTQQQPDPGHQQPNRTQQQPDSDHQTPNQTQQQPDSDQTQIEQYVSWPKDNLEEDTDIGTPHSKIRKLATDHYLQTARRSQAAYTHQSAELHKDYNIGDTVGIRIHQVDRTNTDAKLLPCKVYGKDPTKSAQYELYCATGILKTRYQSSDLINMQHVHFPSLEQINPLSLEEIFSYSGR